ncbi:MAG: DNA primase [Calditrichaeota bacterium]|nr:MAG: DNA primase [Calditrichota bacterium]
MSFIPENIIDEVRLASDVVDVISDYVNLRKKGVNYFGICPFHTEKTGSFSVNAEKQIFHCFGCGAGGNVFTFIMREEGVLFPEAVRLLAKRAGIEIPEPDENDNTSLQEREALYYACELAADLFHAQIFTESGKPALDYLYKREFSDEAIKAFDVGYAADSWDILLKHAEAKHMRPEIFEMAGLLNKKDSGGYYDRFRHRVMFPIRNLAGKVIAFGGRKLVTDDTVPKYVNSPETPIYHKSNVLYGLFQARESIREFGEVIFVEGYTDVIRPAVAGIKNIVATSGTALTDLQARLVNRYTEKVILLYDNDLAGAKATMRGADILVAQGIEVKIAELAEGEDPDSFVQKNGIEALRSKLQAAVPLLDYKTRSLGKTGVDQKESIQSLVGTLSRIQNGIERQEKVREYAERMKINEEVLWEEVRRLRKVQRTRKNYDSKNLQVDIQLRGSATSSFALRSRPVEEELVRIMLIYPRSVPYIFSFMELTDFYNDDYRTIAALMHQLYEHNVRVDAEELVHYFNEPEIANFVSRIVHQEKNAAGLAPDFYRWAADCLANLQRIMLDTKLIEIQSQIRDCEKSGGDATDLRERYHVLQTQKVRIKAENFLPSKNEEK